MRTASDVRKPYPKRKRENLTPIRPPYLIFLQMYIDLLRSIQAPILGNKQTVMTTDYFGNYTIRKALTNQAHTM